MVSSDTLFSYTGCKITFMVHTNASDKQLVALIIQNNKPIAFLLLRLSKPQCNDITTKKEIIAIVQCL